MIPRRYSVEEPPDGQFGVQLDNGSWTGMIELILNQVNIELHINEHRK